MNALNLSPLNRSFINHSQLSSLLNSESSSGKGRQSKPAYNIQSIDDNQYQITIAVTGFLDEELSIETEKNILTVMGKKSEDTSSNNFLHREIYSSNFQQQFTLENHVEVVSASTQNGLLNIELLREIPERMQAKKIAINASDAATISNTDQPDALFKSA